VWTGPRFPAISERRFRRHVFRHIVDYLHWMLRVNFSENKLLPAIEIAACYRPPWHGVPSLTTQPSTDSDIYCNPFLRSFAFSVLALAAAFEALVAISLRFLAVNDLARAKPPLLPSSDITFFSVSGSTTPIIYHDGQGGKVILLLS
jgi:hypothetical protein